MRVISFLRATVILALVFLLCEKPTAQFTIYNSWDFEHNNVGVYTDDQIRRDFDVITNYSHNSANIVLDVINNQPTKVLRVTHPAGGTSLGFDLDARIAQDFDEVYLTYNFKFSEEFSSTGGGKLPGLGGFPVVTANHIPTNRQGFLCKSLFKYAGRITTYHYDRTPPAYPSYCPWATDHYLYDSVFMANGVWYNITRRVKMNSFTNGVANGDGIHELWVNGRLIFQETNLVLMEIESDTMKIDDLNIAHFYGGSSETYAPKYEGYGYIDNIKIWLPQNDPVSGFDLHDPVLTLTTPAEIIDRNFYYDTLMTSPGTISNSQFGSGIYGDCIDETTLIDAGPGNTVSFNIGSGAIGSNDFLFIYDGKTSDARLIDVVAGYSSSFTGVRRSSGRYMFVRFSTNNEGGTTGWTGEVSFIPGNHTYNNPPLIQDQEFRLYESTFTGSIIEQIIASDPDEGQSLTFSVIHGNDSGLFNVNANTGLLTLTNPQNIFSSGEQEYNLTVRVTDNGTDPKSSQANVRILIFTDTDDVNNAPVVEDQQFILSEDVNNGSLIGKITAYDPDPGQTLAFSILLGNEAGIFTLNPLSGDLYSSSGNIFNLNPDSYILLVGVSDGDRSDQAVIHITLERLVNGVYIDPDNKNDVLENGTLSHPFDSWQDIQWTSGFNYRQKRGTVAYESKIIVSASDVTIGGYGEGDKPIIWSSSQDYAFSFFEKSDLEIKDIYVLAENAISCLYFLGDNSGNTTIKNSRFESAVYGIRIVGGSNYTIQYNSFYGISEAIYAYAGKTNIHYNIFQNNQNAVHIDGENSSADIFNNVFYDNNTSVSTSSSEMTLYNNIFYLTRSDDKAFDFSGKKLVSDHNIYYPYQNGFAKIHGESLNELSTLQQVEGIDINSFISDPLFVDALHHNFTVHHESPAIDAGIYVGITSDLAGMTVPYGNKPDIGVIEINELVNFVDEEKTNPILIFPNPSDGRFNITIDNLGQQQTSICIHDISGQKVMEQDYSGFSGGNFRGMIDISNFPSGVYILSMKITDYIYSRKILKSY